jgi:hypothetical protein
MKFGFSTIRWLKASVRYKRNRRAGDNKPVIREGQSGLFLSAWKIETESEKSIFGGKK